MLDRLSLQSDMARFRLYAGTEVDLSSDARLTERRVRAEPLWSEANLSQNKSIDTSVVEESAKVDNVVEKKMNEKVDTKLDEMVDTKTDDTMKERIDTKPLEEEEKREQSMVSEPMDLDEEEMMRLVNESVREAVASREPSPKPSPITPSLNVPEASPASIPAEPVSQPAVPANSAVAPAEVVTREACFQSCNASRGSRFAICDGSRQSCRHTESIETINGVFCRGVRFFTCECLCKPSVSGESHTRDVSYRRFGSFHGSR